jgi:hypothetical protein
VLADVMQSGLHGLWRELNGFPTKRAPPEVQTASKPELLRWIFQFTMGAADAFELRRTELTEEDRAHNDDDVVQSFLDDLAPSGDLSKFFRAAQLAFRSGRTLFVHGGIAHDALTQIPGQALPTLAAFDVDAWIKRLHLFFREQIDAYDNRLILPDGRPAWEQAILYQAPRRGMKSNPGSVVYGRLSDELNNPILPSVDVVNALLRNNIARVVIGHTPTGDLPSVVRTAAHGGMFEVVCADNSRSRVATSSRVHVRDDVLDWHGTCVLDDRQRIDVHQTLELADHDSPVGRRTTEGYLVKARHEDGLLLFRYLPHYEMNQLWVRGSVGTLSDPTPPADDGEA